MQMQRAPELGFDDARLEHLGRMIERDIERETYDGAALCVSRRGKLAALGAFGYADRSAGRALATDDLFVSMSVAKQLTSVVVLNRVERGDLSLSGRVADVIPEFGCRGKENVTLHQMLTHTAGLPFGPPQLPPDLFDNLEAVVAATCASPVESVPGTNVHYSALVAHAVMAEMVRRVEPADLSFREIVARDLLEPLQMKDSALGRPAHLADRVCPVVVRDRRAGIFEPIAIEALGAMLRPESEIPAGGFVLTAPDLGRFANMLQNGGELDGARILSPAMIELATRNQTGEQPNDVWAYTAGMRGWQPFPAALGIGFFLRGEGVFPSPFGTLASPRTFGGLGAGSNMFWIDPERELSCVFLSTGLLEESYNFDRLQRISDGVLASVTN
jgi:CubicO group peptidase (beta-lactamase class C family)